MATQQVLSRESNLLWLRQWISTWFQPLYLFSIVSLWLILSPKYGLEVWLALGWGSYPVLLCLEYLVPFRRDWNTHRRDYKTDLFYLLANERIWSPLIYLLFADPIIHAAETFRATFGIHLWPSAWYLPFKVMLAILVIDFVSYWTHRACHEVKVLWPIHEVHHSSTSMNIMKNTVLHPLEVLIETLSWVVLFLFVGADLPEIMAVMLYDMVTQMFNHSNIELSSPWARSIMMTQREHQLHHSTVYAEGCTNYGERTTVWDRVFGTYRNAVHVCDVGPYYRARPKSLWQQHYLPLKLIGKRFVREVRS